MADMPVVLSTRSLSSLYPLRRRDARGIVHIARSIVNQHGRRYWTPPCAISPMDPEHIINAWPETHVAQEPDETGATCLLCLAEPEW